MAGGDRRDRRGGCGRLHGTDAIQRGEQPLHVGARERLATKGMRVVARTGRRNLPVCQLALPLWGNLGHLTPRRPECLDTAIWHMGTVWGGHQGLLINV